MIIDNDQRFQWNSSIEHSLNPNRCISQTIISMLTEMQKAQMETNSKLDHYFKYFFNNQHKAEYQIESFCFHYPPAPQLLQDKLSTRGSSSYSPCKRLLLSSKSFISLKSPEYFFLYTKRFTEDDQYVEENKSKALYRNKSDQNIKGNKKEMINTEDNEEKHSVRYNNTSSHRTSETTRSNNSNSNSKGKIRGFNFRNKIETNKYNYNHSQPKGRATCDLFNRNHDIYDPYYPTNIKLTNYAISKNDSETNKKPQIVTEKQVKRYWNISIAKPNQLQQKLKENFAKMINKKE